MAYTLITNVTTEVAAELPLKLIDLKVVLYIIFINLVAYILNWLLGFVLKNVSERIGWHRTTITMMIPLMKFIVCMMALY